MAKEQTQQKINYASVTELQSEFEKVAKSFGPAVKEMHPEFGAYMAYSFFLEKGTRHPPGARPHIEPAVRLNAGAIVQSMLDASQEVLGLSNRTNAAIRKVFKKHWLQVLNGKVRIAAVNLGKSQEVFEYGFHLRSILGYMKERASSDIIAQQSAAQTKRKKKKRKTRASQIN
jgi:hypothetical protein